MSTLPSEDIRLLTEVGFLAGARGDLASARKIFTALELCRPDAGFPYVGLAMALMNRREYDEALRTLDRGLPLAKAEDQPDLHAMRALALRLDGRAGESDRAIRAAGNHPMAQALASQPRLP